jgi:UDP-N-acetylglucosamine acyltransferase
VHSRIHPTAFVGPGVDLGRDVVVGPYAVLLGPLTVADEVWIGPGAHLGGPPEIASCRHNEPWAGDLDHHEIRIGARTRIRDGVTIHHGSVRETLVGADCLLFNHCYLAHDVQVGDGVTLSAGVTVGGHATIRDGANLGLNVMVHQRRSIGSGAMVGMGTAVTRDVPPYAKAYGVPPRVHGLNEFLLRKQGNSDETITAIRAWYAGDPGTLPHELEAELAWWDALAERRPMAWSLP